MIAVLFFCALGIAMLAAVVALLPTRAASRAREGSASGIDPAELAARHCRYFPQIRQAFSERDEAYLKRRASAVALRDWREARRRVMREFLEGLYDDFVRLNRSARAVSRMAPQLDNLHEAQLFWMGVRFRLVYRLALLELSAGYRPVNDFLRLAEIVGELGSTLERAASALAEDSALARPSALTS
jgi:hypothetical protein